MEEGLRDICFGSTEAVVNYVKERSDDLEKVVVPQSPELDISDSTGRTTRRPVGMILHFIGDRQQHLHPVDAERLLNDGIFNRMKIRIVLSNQLCQTS